MVRLERLYTKKGGGLVQRLFWHPTTEFEMLFLGSYTKYGPITKIGNLRLTTYCS